MTKKLNGTAKWIIVGIAVLGLAFNTGVTYNHIHTLSKNVAELKVSYEKLDEKFDKLILQLAHYP